MKPFAVICVMCVALAASPASAQNEFTTGYVTTNTRVSNTFGPPTLLGYQVHQVAPVAGVQLAAAPVATHHVVAAAPVATTQVIAAPVATTQVVAAAPAATAVVAAAAPTVTTGTATVTGGASKSEVHEIHTQGSPRRIHVEEHKQGGQVIRVHDSPAAAPSVHNIEGPAPAQAHIRLISRDQPTQITRSVQRGGVQVFDVVNPPKPGDQIIHIRRAAAPPAHVELQHIGDESAPVINLDLDEGHTQVVYAGLSGAQYSAQANQAQVSYQTVQVQTAPAVQAYQQQAYYQIQQQPATFGSINVIPVQTQQYAVPQHVLNVVPTLASNPISIGGVRYNNDGLSDVLYINNKKASRKA